MNSHACPLRARVVIPIFRRWNEADRLVATLSDATLTRAGVSLVVVDDASMDGGAGWLASRYPFLTVIARQANGGFASAVNTGLRDRAWDVAAILNTDTRIGAAALIRLVQAAGREARCIVGPRIVRAETGADIGWRDRFPTPLSILASYLSPLRRRRSPPRFPGNSERVPVAWLEGSCLVFSRGVYDLVGPFDEGYGMYSEEVAWQRLAAARGIPRVGFSDVVAVHGRTGEDTEAAERKQQQLWRSRFRYVGVFHGARAQAGLRAAMAAASPMAAAAAAAREYLNSRSGGSARRAARRVLGAPWLAPSDGNNFREMHDSLPRPAPAAIHETS